MWKLILLSTHFAAGDPGSAFLTEQECVSAGKEVVSQPGTYDIKSSVGLGFACLPSPYTCTASGAGQFPVCYQEGQKNPK